MPTHHTLVAALDLPLGALDLIPTHAIDAVKAVVTPLAALAAVPPVALQVLAPTVGAHCLASRACALAVVAVQGGVGAALAACATVRLVCGQVL